jgi:hypothetical protein
MMYRYKFLTLIVLLGTLFVGCELDSSNSNDSENDDDGGGRPPHLPTPSPIQPPTSGLQGENIFLWKPESESDGNLVVLIPAALSGEPSGTLSVNDNVFGRFSGIHNGNRNHYRFPRPGREYGENIPVVLNRLGIRYEWIVPNGSSRYSDRYP